MTVVVLTAFTLTAFAGNSLLCRMALGGDHIDPVSFTALRLVSGALALLPISRMVAEWEPHQVADLATAYALGGRRPRRGR